MTDADENSIEVTLLGRDYRVTCTKDEREALLQAVAYLDGKMGEIKKTSKLGGTERIAVMAALNIAHELLSVKLGGGLDVGQVKRRISSIEAKLDNALAQQEKLFYDSSIRTWPTRRERDALRWRTRSSVPCCVRSGSYFPSR